MRPAVALRLVALTILVAVGGVATDASAAAPIQIQTLSNRADLISDGHALVADHAARRASAGRSHARTARRHPRVRRRARTRRIEGLVDGLRIGRNRARGHGAAARAARG